MEGRKSKESKREEKRRRRDERGGGNEEMDDKEKEDAKLKKERDYRLRNKYFELEKNAP